MTVFQTQTEYAAHRGVSQPLISKWLGQGKLSGCTKTISGRKLIDRDKADVSLSENLDRIHNKPKKPKKETPKKKNPTPTETKATVKAAGLKMVSLAKAQENRANYEAALKKLELEEKTGDLVDSKTTEMEFFNIARLVRDAILNVPSRIGAELASLTDVHLVNEKMTTELNAALEELSR